MKWLYMLSPFIVWGLLFITGNPSQWEPYVVYGANTLLACIGLFFALGATASLIYLATPHIQVRLGLDRKNNPPQRMPLSVAMVFTSIIGIAFLTSNYLFGLTLLVSLILIEIKNTHLREICYAMRERG